MDNRHRKFLAADDAAMPTIDHQAGTTLGVQRPALPAPEARRHPMQRTGLQP